MTLCIAAVCQERNHDRIVIATDWKAGSEEFAAENEDKLYWITDDIPVMIAGCISRAVELKNTYARYFVWMSQRNPALTVKAESVADIMKRPLAIYRRKRADEYTYDKAKVSFKEFLEAVGKNQIPHAVAVKIFAELEKLDLEAEIIICLFGEDGTAFVYKVSDAGVELCNNFVAIGTGSLIAEGALYQRKQESRMQVGTTLYHVFEAMKLGAISPTVGNEHTLNVLRPRTAQRTVKDLMLETSEQTDKKLNKTFAKYGPKKIRGMSLPREAWYG